jgi:hypothetical protein
MEKQSKIRNPFAGATDEKKVWQELLKNSKPVSKEEFLSKVKAGRKKD